VVPPPQGRKHRLAIARAQRRNDPKGNAQICIYFEIVKKTRRKSLSPNEELKNIEITSNLPFYPQLSNFKESL
jgi:hypothetical protein